MGLIVGSNSNPNFNVYDIRIKCDVPPLCYDMSNSDKLLNDPTVQAKLGVSGRKWEECSNSVHSALLGDWLNNLATKLTDVIESGLDVLVYSGDKDFVCNWRGGEAWTNAVSWSGQEEFQKTAYTKWMVNGKAAGELKKVQNFKFLRVYDAGHMVPMDQPEVALEMLKAFIMGTVQVQSE
jgi:cathepsin A (carboxypeptidase C)